jgi:hypothetical protein
MILVSAGLQNHSTRICWQASQPAVRKFKRKSHLRCSKYLHDGVGERVSHPYETLKSVLGPNHYFERAEQPRKFETGEKKVIDAHGLATGRVGHQRRHKVKKPCNPCECKFSPNDFAAASPELNPAENAQNQLLQICQDICEDGGPNGLLRIPWENGHFAYGYRSHDWTLTNRIGEAVQITETTLQMGL